MTHRSSLRAIVALAFVSAISACTGSDDTAAALAHPSFDLAPACSPPAETGGAAGASSTTPDTQSDVAYAFVPANPSGPNDAYRVPLGIVNLTGITLRPAGGCAGTLQCGSFRVDLVDANQDAEELLVSTALVFEVSLATLLPSATFRVTLIDDNGASLGPSLSIEKTYTLQVAPQGGPCSTAGVAGASGAGGANDAGAAGADGSSAAGSDGSVAGGSAGASGSGAGGSAGAGGSGAGGSSGAAGVGGGDGSAGAGGASGAAGASGESGASGTSGMSGAGVGGAAGGAGDGAGGATGGAAGMSGDGSAGSGGSLAGTGGVAGESGGAGGNGGGASGGASGSARAGGA